MYMYIYGSGMANCLSGKRRLCFFVGGELYYSAEFYDGRKMEGRRACSACMHILGGMDFER